MTTGILGGVFDPPHAGHVALARAAVERFGLDRLLVLVAASPGHKPVATPAEARLALTRAAFAEVPLAAVRLDDHAFTVDFLRAERFDPETTVFLVGADEFASFPAWKEPDEVLERVRLGVATRPGQPEERLEPVLAGLSCVPLTAGAGFNQVHGLPGPLRSKIAASVTLPCPGNPAFTYPGCP